MNIRQLCLPSRPLRGYKHKNGYDRVAILKSDYRPYLLCRTLHGVQELLWDRSFVFSHKENSRIWFSSSGLQKQMCVLIQEGAFPELGHGERIIISKSYEYILDLLDDAPRGREYATQLLAHPEVQALGLRPFYPRGGVQ